LNSIYQALHEPPKLLDYLHDDQFKIIHVVRNNILAVIISEMLAMKTGVWHLGYLDAAKANTEVQLRVDVASLMDRLYFTQAENLAYARILSGRSNTVTVSYESLFGSDRQMNEPDLAAIEAHVGASQPLPRIVEYAKTRTRRLRDLIENVDELEAVLRCSPFAAMLDA
jgi:hypothetical protein